jgi:N-acetylglucosamine-6-phosphate deacetylase
MKSLDVRGGLVVRPDGVTRADVAIRHGRITAVHDRAATDPDGDVEVLDAADLLVTPGFVDLQCNGAHGIDLVLEPERMWELAALLPRYGVTAFLPTIISCPPALVDRAIAALAAPPPDFQGATPLGLHLEGPMLNPARRGAHPPEQLRPPSETPVDAWAASGRVAMVTLAPELPGALDAIRALCAADVVVSAGHTDATADELNAGLDAGVTAATHLFNAMPPFKHREPGAAGAVLADGRVTAGVIVDGVHVHPTAVAAAWAALGPARTALVTDAVAPLGCPPGPFHFGNIEVTVGPDSVRLADGTLAGSILAMDQAVRNLMAFTGCPPHEAVTAATATPARVVGAGLKGRIEPGCDGDLVVLTPSLEVVAVVIAGAITVGHRRL